MRPMWQSIQQWAVALATAFEATPRFVLVAFAVAGVFAAARIAAGSRSDASFKVAGQGLIAGIGAASPAAWSAISVANGWAVAVGAPVLLAVGLSLTVSGLVMAVRRPAKPDGALALQQLMEVQRKMRTFQG